MGFQTLVKNTGYTIAALAIIGIGIGANSAMFSFVDGVALRLLPYSEPDRIVLMLEKTPDGGPTAISGSDYLDWERQTNVFKYMGAEADDFVTLTGIERPEKLLAARVTAQFFDICGIRALLGRTFASGEDQPGKDPVTVLSHAPWEIAVRRRFQHNRAFDSAGWRAAYRERSVPTVFDRDIFQIWIPLTFGPDYKPRTFRFFWSLALLKPGVNLDHARAQMNAIGVRIAQDNPDSN